MGSYYTLSDQALARDLLACPGAPVKEIFWLVDDTATDCLPVKIFQDWEYHGYSEQTPQAIAFSAATVLQDMKTLIRIFFTLRPERRFGAITVLDWIDLFESVANHVTANPNNAYRSCFFE